MFDDALAHGLPRARQTFASHCDVAKRFAGWLGFSSGTQAALEHVYERWDGHGLPRSDRRRRAAARRAVAARGQGYLSLPVGLGSRGARGVLQRRSGQAYEPPLAELAVKHLDELLAPLRLQPTDPRAGPS